MFVTSRPVLAELGNLTALATIENLSGVSIQAFNLNHSFHGIFSENKILSSKSSEIDSKMAIDVSKIQSVDEQYMDAAFEARCIKPTKETALYGPKHSKLKYSSHVCQALHTETLHFDTRI